VNHVSSRFRLVAALAAAAFVLFFAPPAAADEVAPELESQDLRTKAHLELKKLVAALPVPDQRRLTGIYVAFHGEASDPFALASCDDDGDYVVVLSDAMLRLVSHVARAQSYDDANGSRKIEEYAAFLARSQLPGRRLLPPPPGFYVAESAAGTYEDRLRESLAFVVARELTHLRTGQLVCAHPTATKEAGDDTWTAAEQRRALENAATLYPGRATHDAEAVVRVLDAGRMERGALGLLRFLEQYEAEQRVFVPRFAPTYRTHYPQSAARASAIRVAVEGHREADGDRATVQER
jgi:hypothetical protein